MKSHQAFFLPSLMLSSIVFKLESASNDAPLYIVDATLVVAFTKFFITPLLANAPSASFELAATFSSAS